MEPQGRQFQFKRSGRVALACWCALVASLTGACDGGGAASQAGATRGAGISASETSSQTDSGQTSTTSGQTAATGNTSKVASMAITISSPVPASGVLNLWSKESAETQCATFSVTAKDTSDAVVGEAILNFTLISNSAGSTDLGTLASASVTTNKATGVASNVYCPPTFTSANQQKELNIKVTAGTVTATSDLIVVQKQPVYALNFVKMTTQDASSFAFPASRAPTATTAILDLLGAGDYDCAYAQFQLLRNGNAYGNLRGVFSLSRNPPTNVRLAVRGSDGTFPSPQSPYTDHATYAVTPVTTGIYNLPVCAGTQRGSFTISGYVSYTDALSGATKSVTVTTPPALTVAGGLVNYTDMSLAFNTTNARTLIASFNNDALNNTLNFTLNLGSRVDGAPTTENPVQIYAETGRVTVSNSGVPSSSGTVPFSVQILHMESDRPYLVNDYVTAANAAITASGSGSVVPVSSSANTSCDALQLAKSAAWTDTSPPGTSKIIRYRDIARNWSTTLVYAIRGQEAFHDALGSGVYEYAATNQGFVDRNQNGHYDSPFTDLATYLTYAAEEIWVNGTKQNASTTFDPDGKWFIDMQKTYIDRDDDRAYTKGVDLAQECAPGNLDANGKCNDVNPNGKRDAATTIWKSLRMPIYMGTNQVAMTHNAIESGWYNQGTDTSGITQQTASNLDATLQYLYDRYVAEGSTLASDFGATGGVVNYGGSAPFLLTDSSSLGALAFTSSSLAQKTSVFFYAQSLCGTPLPGGSTINVTTAQVGTAPSGSRTLTPKIYMQPGDTLFDSKRVFLTAATGGTATGNATVNADVLDHPAAYQSYPVLIYLELPACTRTTSSGCPTGQTKLDCPAESKNINVKVTTPLESSGITVTGTVAIPAVTGSCG